jgi:uncharacterized membrane protein
MLAMIIMGVGPLQLIPQIRARFPALHRGLGRTYMLAAVTSSIAGLYLTWARPLVNPLSGDIGTSLGGVLVIIFAPIALRHAIARDIPRHRRWALRLFIVASDVWFVRVDAFLRSLLPGGGEITGPMSDVWNIAKHLLPLAVLELYFRARDGSNARVRWGMVAGLFALTMLMGAGIAAVATRLWLPRM